jgi:hypothetical protein
LGWSPGARLIAGTVLLPSRFWLPGTMGEFALPADIASPATAWTTLAAWTVLLAISAGLAWRRGSRPVVMLAVFGVLALAAAVVAGAVIPLTAFAYAPQSYFWMWPTGAFVTVAVAGGVLAGVAGALRGFPLVPAAIGLLVGGVAVVLVASRSVDNYPGATSALTAGERVARPVVDELARGLRRHDVTGPLVVDYSRATFGNYLAYVFLVELHRAGIEFTFPAGDTNLERFGRERCERGQATGRIVLADAGGDPIARDGEVMLADVDAFTDADAAELAALERAFGGWLRDGTVDVDLAGVQYLAGRELAELREVLSTPGRSATGLAALLGTYPDWGVVDVPRHLRDDYDRWIELQTRSAVDDVTILLAPPSLVDRQPGAPVLAVSCLS